MKIINKDITVQLHQSFLTYAKSVIEDRAIPNLEDGLKPVQRRILFIMHDLGLFHTKAYKKSARITGDVMGKLHAHGDASIYDAIVNLVQEFKTRYPLVDGHGNWGSLDDDPAAAMRYTEARLTEYAETLLDDLEMVDYVDNYDGTMKEPIILPATIPNVLLNGAQGIAVGMATSLLPHNLNEICDALIALINKEDNILKYIKGPDFPLGGIAVINDFNQMYITGQGSIKLRAKIHFEEKNIIITELPYQTDKVTIIKQISELEDIDNIRDESSQEGMRIVIETKTTKLKPIAELLYKKTKLETNIHMRNLVLHKGKPKTLGLIDILIHFLEFRVMIVRRRFEKEQSDLINRIHILSGVIIALNNIDSIIQIIKSSKHNHEAICLMCRKFTTLSKVQCEAILVLRLNRLLKMEQEKCLSEIDSMSKRKSQLDVFLSNEQEFNKVLIEEIRIIKSRLGDNRRTVIVDDFDEISYKDSAFEVYYSNGKVYKIKPQKTMFKESICNNEAILVCFSTGEATLIRGNKIGNGDEIGSGVVYFKKFKNQELLCFTKKGMIALIKSKQCDFRTIKLEDDVILNIYDNYNKITILTNRRTIVLNKFPKLTTPNVKGIKYITLKKDEAIEKIFSD